MVSESRAAFEILFFFVFFLCPRGGWFSFAFILWILGSSVLGSSVVCSILSNFYQITPSQQFPLKIKWRGSFRNIFYGSGFNLFLL